MLVRNKFNKEFFLNEGTLDDAEESAARYQDGFIVQGRTADGTLVYEGMRGDSAKKAVRQFPQLQIKKA